MWLKPSRPPLTRTIQSNRLTHPLGEFDGRHIDLWAVQLCGSDFIVERRMALLSPDEKARAERFLFEHHRRTYVLSRGILRELLGRYTSILTGKIRFSYGSKSKRGLVPPSSSTVPILPSWGCMP